MPQCLLTMHMIIMVHCTNIGITAWAPGEPIIAPPIPKFFFLNIQLYKLYNCTTAYTNDNHVYNLLLFIHYRIMANYMQVTLHSEKCLSDTQC